MLYTNARNEQGFTGIGPTLIFFESLCTKHPAQKPRAKQKREKYVDRRSNSVALARKSRMISKNSSTDCISINQFDDIQNNYLTQTMVHLA